MHTDAHMHYTVQNDFDHTIEQRTHNERLYDADASMEFTAYKIPHACFHIQFLDLSPKNGHFL